jgi:hypothetical protein
MRGSPLHGYAPIEYPKWIGNVLVQNAAEEAVARSSAADHPSRPNILSMEINGRSPPDPPPAVPATACDKPLSAVTIRMRRSRERRRPGKRTILCDISARQIEALAQAGFIDPAKRDDAAAVAEGVGHLLDRLTRSGPGVAPGA